MGYTIDFVGIINFHNMTPQGGLVMIPDGRVPPGNIPPHKCSLFVMTKDVVSGQTDWWPAPHDPALEQRHISAFPVMERCTLAVSGIDDSPGSEGRGADEDTLDLSEHKDRLPRLRVLDPDFHADPATAETIVKMNIRRGKLIGNLLSGEAVVSRLVVSSHSGPVTITATAASTVKTLTVSNGAEIVLVNISNPFVAHPEPQEDHFKLYKKLDIHYQGDKLKEPAINPSIPPLPSIHPYLLYITHGGGNIPLPGCSNTGCC